MYLRLLECVRIKELITFGKLESRNDLSFAHTEKDNPQMADTSEENRNKSKGAKDILFDYSQETSLPGVKYTTRKEISIARR